MPTPLNAVDGTALEIAADLEHPGADATALEIAADLERPGADAAAGLEDVDLHATTPSSPSHPHHNDTRKPKRFYYLLPTLIQHRHALMACCLFVLAALVPSLMLGMGLWLDEGHDGALIVDDAPTVVDGAPHNRGWTEETAWEEAGEGRADDGGAAQTEGGGWGEEEVGEAAEATATDTPTPAPWQQEDGDVASLTPFPTTVSLGTAPPPTDGGAQEARWYRTTGAYYSKYLVEHEQTTSTLPIEHEYDAHALGAAFCRVQGASLCSYAAYCPDGRGGAPHGGESVLGAAGAPRGAQWAPARGGTWVQVGSVPRGDGGGEDGGDGRCWTWDEWSGGEEGDVAAQWGADHRQWILCCGNAL